MIEPFGDNIFLTIEQAKLGSLDTSSMKTGVEWGIVEALGPEVTYKDRYENGDGALQLGDKVFVKAWGVDTILYEGKEYFFTSEARKAIVAIVK